MAEDVTQQGTLLIVQYTSLLEVTQEHPPMEVREMLLKDV